ncbi:MAG: adenylate/guanylate cyclase domain-containing protein [Myxococcaceae bacterium]|nr:adenylate/guanylate cyclase domain-containing protein [Myxococcaceae bacterium]
MPAAIATLQSWLVSADCRRRPLDSYVAELARRLVEAGLPLWRLRCGVLAMHPGVFARTARWSRDGGVELVVATSETLASPDSLGSPVQALHTGTARVRQRLFRGEVDFPQLQSLRAAGATDYLAVALTLGDRRSFLSIATDAPGGFDDAQLAAVEGLVPALEARFELESTRFSMSTLLEVYLGPNASRRVLAGDFKRGAGQRIDAAIWLRDLRGFTSLADRLPVQQVVPVLDASFEAMAGPPSEGGEILKFIGDSILAVFPVAGDEAAAARRAVKAAEASLEAFAASAPARAHGLTAGVAVNLDEVMYGNIGVRERLDFTVIGAAVNETARVESVCKPLGVPLVLRDRPRGVHVQAAGGAAGAEREHRPTPRAGERSPAGAPRPARGERRAAALHAGDVRAGAVTKPWSAPPRGLVVRRPTGEADHAPLCSAPISDSEPCHARSTPFRPPCVVLHVRGSPRAAPGRDHLGSANRARRVERPDRRARPRPSREADPPAGARDLRRAAREPARRPQRGHRLRLGPRRRQGAAVDVAEQRGGRRLAAGARHRQGAHHSVRDVGLRGQGHVQGLEPQGAE